MNDNHLKEIREDLKELKIKISDIHEAVIRQKTNMSWFKIVLFGVIGYLAFISKVIFNVRF